jgi:nicotinate phosphoribosyltransferase
MEEGIRQAVAAAGPGLAAIRVDSGDLGALAGRARALLDELDAVTTKVIVTGDLDDRAIRALGAAPVDGFGVGTAVVTGLGSPTAGLIYKLVSIGGRDVAKSSPGKATVGGKKSAWRVASRGEEVVASSPEAAPEGGRPLQSLVMSGGRRQDGPSLEEARAWHQHTLRELTDGQELRLVRVE